MKEYNIKIFAEAENDLDDIVDYLSTFAEQTALKYYDLIIEAIGTLSTMPERNPLARDTQLRLRGYRMLLVKNYIVFYIVKGDTVEIRRILYARRQYERLL
jgi:plasmid stabilization system protein ParE